MATKRTTKKEKNEKKLSPLINIASLWLSRDDEGKKRTTKDGRLIYSGVLLDGTKIRAFLDSEPENNGPNITICVPKDGLDLDSLFDELEGAFDE